MNRSLEDRLSNSVSKTELLAQGSKISACFRGGSSTIEVPSARFDQTSVNPYTPQQSPLTASSSICDYLSQLDTTAKAVEQPNNGQINTTVTQSMKHLLGLLKSPVESHSQSEMIQNEYQADGDDLHDNFRSSEYQDFPVLTAGTGSPSRPVFPHYPELYTTSSATPHLPTTPLTSSNHPAGRDECQFDGNDCVRFVYATLADACVRCSTFGLQCSFTRAFTREMSQFGSAQSFNTPIAGTYIPETASEYSSGALDTFTAAEVMPTSDFLAALLHPNNGFHSLSAQTGARGVFKIADIVPGSQAELTTRRQADLTAEGEVELAAEGETELAAESEAELAVKARQQHSPTPRDRHLALAFLPEPHITHITQPQTIQLVECCALVFNVGYQSDSTSGSLIPPFRGYSRANSIFFAGALSITSQSPRYSQR